MSRIKNIFEIKALFFTVFIIIVVAITGSILYKKLSGISNKISESNFSSVPASMVANQIILELRVAENNARSYHLTKDIVYFKALYSASPEVEKHISTLNKLAFRNKPQKPFIDSVIALSRKRLEMIKQQSYFSDPTVITEELNIINQEIDEAYEKQNKSSSTQDKKDNSDSPKKRKGILDKLFNKKNHIDSLDKTTVTKTNTSINEKQLKKAVLKVKSSQLQQLEEYKKNEYEYAQATHIIRERLDFFSTELKRLEDIKTLEIANSAKKQVNSIKYYSIVFSVIFSMLLFTLGYLIIIYVNKKNQAENALIESKKRSDDLAKAKESFLANMSHEIKTPLNAIYGFTEQILSSELKPEQEKQLKIVKSSVSYLTKLVTDILAYSKLQAGKEKLEFITFNLKKELEEIEVLFKNQANTKGIDLIFNLTELKHNIIKSDLYKIKQVLFNVIGNAIKFTSKGSVKVSLIQLHKNDMNWLEIVVNDTGRGIEAEQLPKLFNEFEQGDDQIKKKYGGTGLGLAITKQIIEKLGGKITIDSKIKIGTNVHITLPYTISTNTELSKQIAGKKINLEFLKEKNILIADDEEFNRLLLKSILKKYDPKIHEASNGTTAIEIVKKHKIDVVLMDIRMPETNGIEATELIRKFNTEVLIIGATAVASEEKIAKCLHAGMNSVIFKPYTEQELSEKLRDIFNISIKQEPVITTPDHGQQIKTELLNLENIDQHFEGNESFKKEMIFLFHKSINKSLEEIKTFYQIKNYIAISEIAHKIIPSCKHFEANELIAILKYFEACRDQEINDEIFYHEKIEALQEQIQKINGILYPFL